MCPKHDSTLVNKLFSDHVKFGEVAQAPPKLSPRKQRNSHSSQNKKVRLYDCYSTMTLVHPYLCLQVSELLLAGGSKICEERKKEKEVVGLRHQQLLEKERMRAIAMYRDLKKSRH